MQINSQNFYKRQSQVLQDRKETNRERDKFSKGMVSKENQKEAKKLEKDGWKVNGGNPSIGFQLQTVSDFETYRDEDNNRIYITGSGSGSAKTREKATIQAQLMAQKEMAEQIETNIASLEKGGFINDKLEIDAALKGLVQATLKRSEIIKNLYKRDSDGTYKVEQIWAIDTRALEKELEKIASTEKKAELEKLHEELNQKIDF